MLTKDIQAIMKLLVDKDMALSTVLFHFARAVKNHFLIEYFQPFSCNFFVFSQCYHLLLPFHLNEKKNCRPSSNIAK